MCKYCNIKENGMAEDDFTAVHDMGFMGTFVAYCGIELGNDGNFNLAVSMAIDNSDSDDLDNFEGYVGNEVINQRIYYCPICGRKLDE